MKYKVDDVIKATVTKSKPGQHVGLVLEERYHRVFVTDVSGLFKTNGVPVHVDDQLLEVNGMGVNNKAVFPNGVDDINKFLRGEWNIWIKVKKGRDSEDDNHDTRDDDTDPTVAAYPSIKPLRQFYQHRRRHNHHQVSSDSEDSTIANSDEDNAFQPEEQTPRRKPRSRSTSPFRALVTPEKRTGVRKPKSILKGLSKGDDGESVSENTDTTFSLSEDDNTQPRTEAQRTCQTPNLLSIEEDEDSASLSPLTPKEDLVKQSSETTIKSIKGNAKEITVEMNNGQSVCVTPEQLLKAASDHGIEDNIGPPSVYTPKKKRSKGKLKDKSRSPRSTKKSSKSTKEIRKKSKKAPRRRSTGFLRPSAENESLASISESQASSKQDLRKHLTKTPRRKSLGALNRDAEDSDSEDQQQQPRLKVRGSPRCSMDESTHSCMTNLIDPGDLMKIKGFVSKPEMNGMTVEVVRKSKGSKGKRWDVRLITKKDVKVKSSFNPKRLISVATDNLKHFM